MYLLLELMVITAYFVSVYCGIAGSMRMSLNIGPSWWVSDPTCGQKDVLKITQTLRVCHICRSIGVVLGVNGGGSPMAVPWGVWVSTVTYPLTIPVWEGQPVANASSDELVACFV